MTRGRTAELSGCAMVTPCPWYISGVAADPSTFKGNGGWSCWDGEEREHRRYRRELLPLEGPWLGPSPALPQLQAGLSTFLGLGAAAAEPSRSPGEEGESLCYTDHCSNTSTTLDRPQHGIIGLQGLDIQTNQQRNSLQLCTMGGNPLGVLGVCT